MKRPNGTGSVYKRNDTKRRKPYTAEVTLGYTDTGKRIRKVIGSFEKRTDAWKALYNYFGNPELYNAQKITFGQCWDKMIEAKSRLGISMTVYNSAKARCQHIWNRPIQELRLYDLQHIVDSANLKPSTKRSIKVALNAVFTLAYENDYITKNYAQLIKTPALGPSVLHTPFSLEDVKEMWNHTEDDAIKIALIYIYTGARPTELLTMKWESVNLDEQYMVGGIKTTAGKNRHIPIADCILLFMKYFRDQNKNNLFGFTTINTLRVRLKEISQRYPISLHIPHDTRHTFVTLANTYNLKEVIVKRIVGHSRGKNVTESVYTHTTHKQHLDEVNKLPFAHHIIL